MNVLVDKHHAALFYSLQLLFEDRLGHTVWTPVGHEWWDAGYWQFGKGYGDDRLAQQFLIDPTFPDPHYPDRPVHAVTLEDARGMDWAYVVATVQDNQHGFARFADEVGAKFVLQVGNINADIDWRLDPIALISAEHALGGKAVRYHQEFDSDGIFAYQKPLGEPVVSSFVNCFNSTYCYKEFERTKLRLPDWGFWEYGIDGPDGNIEDIFGVAVRMRISRWGWHDKVQGDGFGHVIHSWAAIGRPIIGHAQHYKGTMAEPFWQDMVTCIDLDRHSVEEVAEILSTMPAEQHRAMCEAIRATFDSLVDYAAEAESIRALLEA